MTMIWNRRTSPLRRTESVKSPGLPLLGLWCNVGGLLPGIMVLIVVFVVVMVVVFVVVI